MIKREYKVTFLIPDSVRESSLASGIDWYSADAIQEYLHRGFSYDYGEIQVEVTEEPGPNAG